MKLLRNTLNRKQFKWQGVLYLKYIVKQILEPEQFKNFRSKNNLISENNNNNEHILNNNEQIVTPNNLLHDLNSLYKYMNNFETIKC